MRGYGELVSKEGEVSMVDLLPSIGMALTLIDSPDNPLMISADVAVGRHTGRSLEVLRPFLADPDAVGPRYPYHVYEDVMNRADQPWVTQTGLHFDIAVILPGVLGLEWMKTAGHFHRPVRNHALPELVEVAHGKGSILLQLMRTPDRISEIVLLRVVRGDWVVIPPGYGHVSINTASAPLILTHVRSRAMRLEYEEMARHRGAGYWIGPQGQWMNTSYEEVPEAKQFPAADLYPRPFGNLSVYRATRRHLDYFKFLWGQDAHHPAGMRDA